MTTTTTLITGNTYPHRETLKALGGRWNPTSKGWAVPASRAAEALAIVGGLTSTSGYRRASTSITGRGRGRVGRCWECGATTRPDRDGMCGVC